MLSVNSPKPQVIIENLDKQEIDGVSFEVVRVQGLSVIIRTNGDDAVSKDIVKRKLKDLPELKYMVANVMIVDEQGRTI